MDDKKITRKDTHLRVPVLPEEKAKIEDSARAAGGRSALAMSCKA